MTLALAKFAPPVLAMAVTGYCVWPYLDAPEDTNPPARPALPKIEPQQLSPTLAPTLERNPFELAGALAPKPVAEEKAKTAASQSAARPGGRMNRPADRKPEASRSLLEGWSLGATVVHGPRRGAIINGKVYDEGEMVAPPQRDGKGLRLARVERDRVLLQEPGRSGSVALGYSRSRGKKASAPASRPIAEAMPPAALPEDPSLSIVRGLLGGLTSPDIQKVLSTALPAGPRK